MLGYLIVYMVGLYMNTCFQHSLLFYAAGIPLLHTHENAHTPS